MIPSPVIYVVDDDPTALELVTLQLLAGGFSVRAFGSAADLLENRDFATRGCIVSDVRMPHMDGIELLEEINSRQIHLPMVIMTANGNVALSVRAMRAGAVEFLEKPFSRQSLLDSVNYALSIAETSNNQRAKIAASRARVEKLTTREKDVLSLILAGKPTKSIAHELDISPRTVDAHRSSIMKGLGASNIVELVRLTLPIDEFAHVFAN